MWHQSFSPALLSDFVVERCKQPLSASADQICNSNWDKEPLIVSSKFPFAYVHHCPWPESVWVRLSGFRQLSSWSSAPSCSPIVAHSFPTAGCEEGHLWGLQWEEVGTVLRWARNKGLQTSGAALLTSMQGQKIVFKTKNITIRFDLGLNVSIWIDGVFSKS